MRLTVPRESPSTAFQAAQSPLTRKSPLEVAASPNVSDFPRIASPYQTRSGSAVLQGAHVDPASKLKKAAPPTTDVTAPSEPVSIISGADDAIWGVARRHATAFGASSKTPAREAANTSAPFGAASTATTGAAGFGKSTQLCPPLTDRNNRAPDATKSDLPAAESALIGSGVAMVFQSPAGVRSSSRHPFSSRAPTYRCPFAAPSPQKCQFENPFMIGTSFCPPVSVTKTPVSWEAK